jgi:hypothetical protein
MQKPEIATAALTPFKQNYPLLEDLKRCRGAKSTRATELEALGFLCLQNALNPNHPSHLFVLILIKTPH